MKPMLAVKADLSKIQFPGLVQPKLDGVRAVVKDGKLLSRTLKPIRNEHCQKLFSHLEGFDGELVVGCPTDKKVFETTTSGVMSKDGGPDVTFYVFDLWNIPNKSFVERFECLQSKTHNDNVKVVPTILVDSLEDLDSCNANFIKEGYEGTIVRSLNGTYKFGRSTVKEGRLLKMKLFQDDEFEVVGFTELYHNKNEATKNALGYTERSSHKDSKVLGGALGSLVLKYKDTTFEVGTGFSQEQRREIFENQSEYLGKMAKVTYQEQGMKDLPRFPSFKGFRDRDDM